MSGRPRLRAFALVWGLLQLSLPASSAIAEARLAATAARSPAGDHIEAPGRDCPRVHPPDCGICKQLTASSLPEVTPRVVFVIRTRGRAALDRLVAPALTPHGAALARAPPERV
jgi:hypothetical protein